jgi:Glu/Leu/Phe/Val dehydrogenase, dimerisation domain
MESKSVSTFEELLESWDGETALIHRARESGAWIFVCLHSTRLGPAGGGTRMNVYDTPAEALLDAMRLSAAMTRKLAVAGLPFGGGKAVIAVPEIPSGEERRALLLRYGDLVASLVGAYRTSSDINTGETDMDASSRSSDSSSSAGANPSSTRHWRRSARRYGRSTRGPTREASRRRQPPTFLPRRAESGLIGRVRLG